VSPSLLDTDIFSEILKGVDQTVAARATDYRAQFGRYTISVITVMEVVKGLHKIGSARRLRRFLAGLPSVEVLEFDVVSAELAGRIYADLERTGQPIGRADPQVAAIALRHDLALVTGNQAHYERIRTLGYGLRLDNWRG
jgi:tRNA(fMet)-specific endonuclease VapC